MAKGDWVLVQECDVLFILIDDERSCTFVDDTAEYAAQVGDSSFTVSPVKVDLVLLEVNNFDEPFRMSESSYFHLALLFIFTRCQVFFCEAFCR